MIRVARASELPVAVNGYGRPGTARNHKWLRVGAAGLAAYKWLLVPPNPAGC